MTDYEIVNEFLAWFAEKREVWLGHCHRRPFQQFFFNWRKDRIRKSHRERDKGGIKWAPKDRKPGDGQYAPGQRGLAEHERIKTTRLAKNRIGGPPGDRFYLDPSKDLDALGNATKLGEGRKWRYQNQDSRPTHPDQRRERLYDRSDEQLYCDFEEEARGRQILDELGQDCADLADDAVPRTTRASRREKLTLQARRKRSEILHAPLSKKQARGLSEEMRKRLGFQDMDDVDAQVRARLESKPKDASSKPKPRHTERFVSLCTETGEDDEPQTNTKKSDPDRSLRLDGPQQQLKGPKGRSTHRTAIRERT